MGVGVEHYEGLLRSIFGGRKVIVCADVLVGAWGFAKALAGWGAERPLLISGSPGTGELPTPDEAEQILLDTGGDSVMLAIRAFEDALRALPDDAMRTIDDYDPNREAIVVGTIFTRDGTTWGRQAFGCRPISWERMEDKMVVDGILDDAGVVRAPSEIVPVSDVGAACSRFDQGMGCALAGDAREGWWGGAEFFRWVRNDDDLTSAKSFFAEHCDRVRVMPFLEGIPCSIHGIVFADDVIALRPVEMLVLRRPGSKLLYAGLDTYWDPPDGDREEMRETAKKLGSHLRDRVDYRGAFTLDGVMTSDGFRPTEINPRAGAGMNPQGAGSGVPIGILSRAIRDFPDLDYRLRDLEALVVEGADAERRGACYTVIDQKITETTEHKIVDDGTAFRRATEGETPDGTMALGPSGVGGLVRYDPDVSRLPIGESFAPRAVRAFAFADHEFNSGFGPLEPAAVIR